MKNISKLIKISILLVLFSNVAIFAKDEIEPISCDRPDQTESVNVMPLGFFQFETGFGLEQISEFEKSISYPSMLIKYGILEKMELRLIIENSSTTFKVLEKETKVAGLSPLAIGVKMRIQDENGFIPSIAFLGHLHIPKASSEELEYSFYAPSFRFSVEHTLSDNMSLGYNVGAEWDGETAEPQFIYTLVTGISLTEELGTYLELYGFAPQNSPANHRFDCGLTYTFTDNMMVDVSGGVGLNEYAPDYFVAAGFSFRLPR